MFRISNNWWAESITVLWRIFGWCFVFPPTECLHFAFNLVRGHGSFLFVCFLFFAGLCPGFQEKNTRPKYWAIKGKRKKETKELTLWSKKIERCWIKLKATCKNFQALLSETNKQTKKPKIPDRIFMLSVLQSRGQVKALIPMENSGFFLFPSPVPTTFFLLNNMFATL